jgi:hypothetical protein
MRMFATLAVAQLLLLAPQANAGDLGGCYDGAIASCDLIYPESENWGTPRYRACIKALLDECDAKHKSPQGLGLKATPEKKPLSLKLN